MIARKQRGQVIAETLPINKMGEAWVVPSQSGKGVYVVGKDEHGNRNCQCPDFSETGMACKHIFAVEFKVSPIRHTPTKPASSKSFLVRPIGAPEPHGR